VRRVIAEIAPAVAIDELKPMSQYVDRAMAPTRFSLVLIAVFGAVAAVLAAIGLYGVLATAVRQRTAEIGVRMAFGASNDSIFRLMIGEGLALSGIGIVVGLIAAFALTGVMEKASMLVAIKPTDPATYGSIAVLFWRSRWCVLGAGIVVPRVCSRRRRCGRRGEACCHVDADERSDRPTRVIPRKPLKRSATGIALLEAVQQPWREAILRFA
jgi:predicted lysophospholipase L1 biosynthesis ABC-type transport system permease subunit